LNDRSEIASVIPRSREGKRVSFVSRLLFGTTISLVLAACTVPRAGPRAARLDAIEHVVVIYAENRSFDHLYGLFPHAHGIYDATRITQVDRDGTPLRVLPPVWQENAPDPVFPTNLPNAPFRIDAPPISLPLSAPTRDLVHRFYQNQAQIDGGKLDKYAAISDAGGLVMGYYDGSALPMWRWARQYTLADDFFMGAFGGSFLNHFWLICACTPVHPDAPPSMRVQLDRDGLLKRRPDSPASALSGPPSFFDGTVTPDGYAVNTEPPPFEPSQIPPAPGGDARFANPAGHPLPPQNEKTIGDTLSSRGVSWAWYAGGWEAATRDGMQPPDVQRTVILQPPVRFQPQHQPFNYFARFAPGTAERAQHLKDYRQLLEDLDNGTLPQVVFYKPQGSLDEHPGYATILPGDQQISDVVARIRASPVWRSTAIIVTYDENGGFWDHVPPPAGDRWGPGTRVPAIIISPFARRGFVDHTPYDTTSILKFITRRFDLEPLPGVRPQMGDLTAAFDL
jgi:acid phosphatase